VGSQGGGCGLPRWAPRTHTINVLRGVGAFISRADHERGLRFHLMFSESKTAGAVACAGNLSLGTALPLVVVSSVCAVPRECATTQTARRILFSEVWSLHSVILFVLPLKNEIEKISAQLYNFSM